MRELLLSLPRNFKRLLLISIDFVTLSLAVWASLIIRSDNFFYPSEGYILTGATPEHIYAVIFLAPLITIPILILSRLYRSITRYITIETYVKITKACVVGAIIWSFIVYFLFPIPRSVFIIYLIVSTGLVYLTRFIARDYLLNTRKSNIKNILIFGIGNSSRQIAEILRLDLNINPVGFISENKEDKKTSIAELPVFTHSSIDKIMIKKDIQEILVTSDHQSKDKLRDIIKKLEMYQTKIRKLPNIAGLTRGEIKSIDKQRINIEDLLGRDTIKPDPYLLKACIQDKVVLITGCGGSIGSELARQIINLKPKKIILLEQSEYFLYEIDRELNEIVTTKSLSVKIKSYLGSVCDKDLIKVILSSDTIDTIYHAAANKHVPLVEHNPLSAIKNNILGTYIIASESYKKNVDNFVLISSDKAVRPTNIMGATKRFAELILQSFQDVVDNMPATKSRTKFCMVRFGNVLDTSGSVVPLFKKQIQSGGPVTVTHPDVIRYFMTITEASELVIQAGSLSKGGDVFVLDMGEPMNIFELAKQMIKLSGKTIRDNSNTTGDVEIKFTNLRDGEKLYEELLIGDNVQNTVHPHIMSANEEKLSYDRIIDIINKLEDLNASTPIKDIQQILYDTVSGYKPYKSDNIVELNID